MDVLSEVVGGLPNPEIELMKGVKWGSCDQLFTPAYWKVQYHLHEDLFCNDFYRMGFNIVEEICACILGGFGMKAEHGMIAFERLRDLDLLKAGSSFEEIYTALSVPLLFENKRIKYRFPKQKSKYLVQFLNRQDLQEIPTDDDILLRDWLLTVNGIGMKTASWITRNWLDSKKVAILDIHIYRAGLIAGFFEHDACLNKDYRILEQKYLSFSAALDVNPANLDSLIWLQLKMANNIAIDILKNKN